LGDSRGKEGSFGKRNRPPSRPKRDHSGGKEREQNRRSSGGEVAVRKIISNLTNWGKGGISKGSSSRGSMCQERGRKGLGGGGGAPALQNCLAQWGGSAKTKQGRTGEGIKVRERKKKVKEMRGWTSRKTLEGICL